MASEPYRPNLRVQKAPTFVQPEYNTPESQMPSEKGNPNSSTNLMTRLSILQSQAIADSIYDPAIPPPKEGFVNYGRQNLLLSLVAGALMVGLHIYLKPNCWPKLLYK
jgi:hypothetical protein